jgi:hypothetical protein
MAVPQIQIMVALRALIVVEFKKWQYKFNTDEVHQQIGQPQIQFWRLVSQAMKPTLENSK